MNQLNQKQGKLKNTISFGNQDSKLIYGLSTSDLLSINSQSSQFIDIDLQLNNLGLEVIKVSQKILDKNNQPGQFCYIDCNKIKNIIQTIKDVVGYLKDQISIIKRKFKEFFQKEKLQKIIYQLNQKFKQFNIYKTLQHNQLSIELPNILSLPTNKSPHLLLSSTVFSISLSKQSQIPQQTDQSSEQPKKKPPTKNQDLSLELKKLRQETELKNKQIQLLKEQLLSIKKLSEKKQDYFNQKLKLKQIEWQRKINQIINEWNHEKKNATNHNHQNHAIQQKLKKRFKTQKIDLLSTRNNSPKTYQWNFNQRKTINLYQNHVKFNNQCLQQKNSSTGSLSQSLLKNINHTNSNLIKDNDSNTSHEKLFQNKLRIQKQKTRQQSTDLSFQRVCLKIKHLQSSFKK